MNKFIKIISFKNNPYKYIFKSDVKILSSRYEGNPNILLETACLKKLIISTDCKVGPREILNSGNRGILFKVEDYQKLFEILKSINIKSNDIKKKLSIIMNMSKKIIKMIYQIHS